MAENQVRQDKVAVGDIMTFTYWGKVKAVDGDHLTVDGLDKGLGEFHVRGTQLIEQSGSANQHGDVVKVTRTEMAEKLIGAGRRPLTVCFVKQDGEQRVLVGRLVDHEALLGRSRVEDLERPEGDRLRLVDHRTLQWLVVGGVRYEVKER